MSIRFTGLASGLDTDSMIKQLMKVERMKVDRVIKQKTRLEWTQNIWKDMNQKLYDFYRKPLFDMRSKSTFTAKTVTSSNAGVASVTANGNAVTGAHTLEVKEMAKGSYLTSEPLAATTNLQTKATELFDFGTETSIQIKYKTDGVNEHTITIDKDTDTLETILGKLREDNNLNISYDSNHKRIFMSTKSTGNDMMIDFSQNDPDVLLGLGIDITSLYPPLEGSSLKGSDAKFLYNGTELTSKTNEATVNGLSIKILSEGTTTLSVNQDVDGIYNKVKDFINQYNTLIAEINTKIDAPIVRTYEPLTSEEKSGMTEEEIKIWEDTVKGSLLRRDSVLEGLGSSMRMILTSGQDKDTFKFSSLSTLGIRTGNYKEGGILHIYGDEDSLFHSNEENKLKKAIAEDPEAVAQLFNTIADKLYSEMGNKMKSTNLSSALTFFNDKQMNDRIKDYDKEITKLEDRLLQIEDRYYRQFTAMEKAMQAANNQMSWLMQQLGGGMQ